MDFLSFFKKAFLEASGSKSVDKGFIYLNGASDIYFSGTLSRFLHFISEQILTWGCDRPARTSCDSSHRFNCSGINYCRPLAKWPTSIVFGLVSFQLRKALQKHRSDQKYSRKRTILKLPQIYQSCKIETHHGNPCWKEPCKSEVTPRSFWCK